MKVESIATELGDKIIKDLRKRGWKKVKEYSWFAFDKGIDFDSYTLRKDGKELYFEWTNWFEWEITGPEAVLETIAKEYQLSANRDADT